MPFSDLKEKAPFTKQEACPSLDAETLAAKSEEELKALLRQVCGGSDNKEQRKEMAKQLLDRLGAFDFKKITYPTEGESDRDEWPSVVHLAAYNNLLDVYKLLEAKQPGVKERDKDSPFMNVEVLGMCRPRECAVLGDAVDVLQHLTECSESNVKISIPGTDGTNGLLGRAAACNSVGCLAYLLIDKAEMTEKGMERRDDLKYFDALREIADLAALECKQLLEVWGRKDIRDIVQGIMKEGTGWKDAPITVKGMDEGDANKFQANGGPLSAAARQAILDPLKGKKRLERLMAIAGIIAKDITLKLVMAGFTGAGKTSFLRLCGAFKPQAGTAAAKTQSAVEDAGEAGRTLGITVTLHKGIKREDRVTGMQLPDVSLLTFDQGGQWEYLPVQKDLVTGDSVFVFTIPLTKLSPNDKGRRTLFRWLHALHLAADMSARMRDRHRQEATEGDAEGHKEEEGKEAGAGAGARAASADGAASPERPSKPWSRRFAVVLLGTHMDQLLEDELKKEEEDDEAKVKAALKKMADVEKVGPVSEDTIPTKLTRSAWHRVRIRLELLRAWFQQFKDQLASSATSATAKPGAAPHAQTDLQLAAVVGFAGKGSFVKHSSKRCAVVLGHDELYEEETKTEPTATADDTAKPAEAEEPKEEATTTDGDAAEPAAAEETKDEVTATDGDAAKPGVAESKADDTDRDASGGGGASSTSAPLAASDADASPPEGPTTAAVKLAKDELRADSPPLVSPDKLLGMLFESASKALAGVFEEPKRAAFREFLHCLVGNHPKPQLPTPSWIMSRSDFVADRKLQAILNEDGRLEDAGPEDMNDLLDYLERLGVILIHRKDNTKANDVVVLSITALINAMHRVTRHAYMGMYGNFLPENYGQVRADDDGLLDESVRMDRMRTALVRKGSWTEEELKAAEDKYINKSKVTTKFLKDVLWSADRVDVRLCNCGVADESSSLVLCPDCHRPRAAELTLSAKEYKYLTDIVVDFNHAVAKTKVKEAGDGKKKEEKEGDGKGGAEEKKAEDGGEADVKKEEKDDTVYMFPFLHFVRHIREGEKPSKDPWRPLPAKDGLEPFRTQRYRRLKLSTGQYAPEVLSALARTLLAANTKGITDWAKVKVHPRGNALLVETKGMQPVEYRIPGTEAHQKVECHLRVFVRFEPKEEDADPTRALLKFHAEQLMPGDGYFAIVADVLWPTRSFGGDADGVEEALGYRNPSAWKLLLQVCNALREVCGYGKLEDKSSSHPTWRKALEAVARDFSSKSGFAFATLEKLRGAVKRKGWNSLLGGWPLRSVVSHEELSDEPGDEADAVKFPPAPPKRETSTVLSEMTANITDVQEAAQLEFEVELAKKGEHDTPDKMCIVKAKCPTCGVESEFLEVAQVVIKDFEVGLGKREVQDLAEKALAADPDYSGFELGRLFKCIVHDLSTSPPTSKFQWMCKDDARKMPANSIVEDVTLSVSPMRWECAEWDTAGAASFPSSVNVGGADHPVGSVELLSRKINGVLMDHLVTFMGLDESRGLTPDKKFLSLECHRLTLKRSHCTRAVKAKASTPVMLSEWEEAQDKAADVRGAKWRTVFVPRG